MYGCFLVEPDDDGANLGVLFWHKDGYSTACGHGTIALGAWAVESGVVAAPRDGEVAVTVDVPSGRVAARVRTRDGAVDAVTFCNVPVVRRRARRRRRPGVTVDVSYGGAIYASVARRALRAARRPRRPARRSSPPAARSRRRSRAPTRRATPTDERLSGIYGTILYEDARRPAPAQRDDLRRRRGRPLPLRLGDLGALRAAGRGRAPARGRRPAPRLDRGLDLPRPRRRPAGDGVLTEVEGMAYRTGEHRFVLDPRDPLGTGFVLR